MPSGDVHLDVRRERFRQGARKRYDARLRGAVVDVIRPSLKPAEGGDDNNPAVALALHDPGGCLGTEKRCLQVYAQHLVPIVFAELVPLGGKEDARVVDQQIEPAEAFLDRPEQRRHLLWGGIRPRARRWPRLPKLSISRAVTSAPCLDSL
jgi:hypothetical protein